MGYKIIKAKSRLEVMKSKPIVDEKYQSKSKGIWFPNEMILEHELSGGNGKYLGWVAKFIFLEIHSYTQNKKDCYFSNAYLANKYHITNRQVSKHISELVKMGWIKQVSFDGKKRFLKSLKTTNYNSSQG